MSTSEAVRAAGTRPGGEIAYHLVRPARGELGTDVERRIRDGMIREMGDMRLDELFVLRPSLLAELDHLVVAESAGRACAVLGSRWESTADGDDFLHIGVQFVGRAFRKGPVFVTSWLRLLEAVSEDRHFPWLSALKTYNPVAYCAMERFGAASGGTISPGLIAPTDSTLLAPRVVSAIAESLCPGAPFDPSTGRIAGVGRPVDLYRRRPRSRSEAIDQYFAETLTEPDDRLLVVVQLDPDADSSVWARFQERSVTR